jgi:hypothetical protein
MALATYGELEAAVNRYFRRTDRGTQIQDWVRLVELEVGRELDLRSQQLTDTGTLSGGSTTLETPVGILYPQQLVFDGQPPINVEIVTFPQGEEYAFAAAGAPTPTRATVWGVTSDFKTQIRVWPAPTGDVDYTLYYTTGITPLTSVDATNYLLYIAADLYLFGCYYHGCKYDKDLEGANTWRPDYDKAIAQVRSIEKKARAKVGRLTMRPRGWTP